MGFQDYISETEAAQVTGVSLVTLNRFAEAGYLHIEVDSDGTRLFAKSELKSVFGIHDDEPMYSGEVLDAPLDVDIESEDTVRPVFITPTPSPEPTAVLRESSPNEEVSQPTRQKRAPILDQLEREVTKLRSLTDLQEKLLDLRDRELSDLKEQRDWLKSRVEKLEEQRDRDQIILVSETQTIRRLLVSLEQRKSPIRSTLEWFGFIQPEPKPQPGMNHLSSTIEIQNQNQKS